MKNKQTEGIIMDDDFIKAANLFGEIHKDSHVTRDRIIEELSDVYYHEAVLETIDVNDIADVELRNFYRELENLINKIERKLRRNG